MAALETLIPPNDDEFRSLQQKGLEITLAGHMRQLSSIKQLEFYWVGLHSALIVPAIGFLLTPTGEVAQESPQLLFICVAYFLLTTWFQWVLYEQRQSYYAVMRSMRRVQNLFGLHKLVFLSSGFYDAAFPRGYGVTKEKNGTQPFRSFLHRLTYLAVLYIGLVSAATLRGDFHGYWIAVAIIAEIVVLIALFVCDGRKMRKALDGEANLAGTVTSDYPCRSPRVNVKPN